MRAIQPFHYNFTSVNKMNNKLLVNKKKDIICSSPTSNRPSPRASARADTTNRQTVRKESSMKKQPEKPKDYMFRKYLHGKWFDENS